MLLWCNSFKAPFLWANASLSHFFSEVALLWANYFLSPRAQALVWANSSPSYFVFEPILLSAASWPTSSLSYFFAGPLSQLLSEPPLLVFLVTSSLGLYTLSSLCQPFSESPFPSAHCSVSHPFSEPTPLSYLFFVLLSLHTRFSELPALWVCFAFRRCLSVFARKDYEMHSAPRYFIS